MCLICFRICNAPNEMDQGVDIIVMLATGPLVRKYVMVYCVRPLSILSDTPSNGSASRPFG